MTDDAAALDEPAAPDDDIAPRARPGYRSPRGKTGLSANQMAALFAGVLRAGIGLLGYFGALLYLPTHQATPILAGISIVLVVTGNVSVFRAIDGHGGVRLLFRALLGVSLLGLAVITGMVVVLGAGVFGPTVVPMQDDGPPVVRFEMGR